MIINRQQSKNINFIFANRGLAFMQST